MYFDTESLFRRFHYILPIAAKYGAQEVWILGKKSSVDNLNGDDFLLLKKTYESLQCTEGIDELAKWCDQTLRLNENSEEKQIATSIIRLFGVFELLARKRIDPFKSRTVELSVRKKLDWSKLPKGLSYLIPFAEKYGHLQTEEILVRSASMLTDAEKQKLLLLAKHVTVNNQYTLEVQKWLNDYPMHIHPEAAQINAIFALMDIAGLEFT